eukprot:3934276-Rhodomonas_salina.1
MIHALNLVKGPRSEMFAQQSRDFIQTLQQNEESAHANDGIVSSTLHKTCPLSSSVLVSESLKWLPRNPATCLQKVGRQEEPSA